ncbi:MULTISPECIES: DUF975 family protein [Desulfitobacterium]|uniref:Putative integral membrane protein n=1 Tax=Desulfitobacterium dehalogenans (strain ATCC 51507 / DSM 9161 / JW/IU-DC1) TaxID=756499 RepID=I4AAJ4_DESDJ|nr:MULTISPECIES: DUF975 family protein [Desulfitobacterium]AFM00979.1 putative integral membrane protein [Desulfitobacterium dehalogenans ATCC 51507]
MKSNAELKTLARENLKEKWLIAIIVSVVAWMLTDAFTGNSGRETVEYVWRNGEFVKTVNHSNAMFSLIAFIIGGPINFGLASFFLKLARDQESTFSELFSGFHYFLKNFVMNFFIILFTTLWFLLLIIPGIIAVLRYSMAYYIMNDNPDLKPLEAIDLSKKMMYGHKERLFFLWLSFIGWFLLGIFTLGIGFLYAMPYYNATLANFYEDVKDNAY